MKKFAHGPLAAASIALGAATFALAGGAPATAAPYMGGFEWIKNTESQGSTGTNINGIMFKVSEACNSAATRHVVKVIRLTPTNPADKAEADRWILDNLYAPVGVNLPGPLTVQSNGAIKQVADSAGQQIVPGEWEFELRCTNNFGNVIYEQWRGTVIFDSPTAWHVPAQTPVPTTSTTSAPTTTTAPPTSTTTTTAPTGTTTTTTAPTGTTTTTTAPTGTTTTTTAPTGTTTTSPSSTTSVPTTTSGITATLNGEVLEDGAELEAGDRVLVKAEGFDPREPVSVTLSSTPLVLTTLTADASGVVNYTFTVPSTLAAGAHSLTFAGSTSGVQQVFAFEIGDGSSVLDPVADALASTGANAGLVGGLAALLVAAGGGLLFARYRTRHGANVRSH